MKGRWRYDFTLSSDASAVFRRSGSCLVHFEDRDDPANRTLDHHVEIASLPQTGPALVSDWSSEEVAAGRAEGRPIYWQGRMTFTDEKNLLFGEVELSGPGSELVGHVLYDGNLVSTIRGSWTAGLFFDKFACWTLGEFDPSVIDVRKQNGEWVRTATM